MSSQSKSVSETCMVTCDHGFVCCKPATRAYPAMGGGYMSLCPEHAAKHEPDLVSIEAAKRNEWPEAWARLLAKGKRSEVISAMEKKQ